MREVFIFVWIFLQKETKIEDICDGHSLSVKKIVKLVFLHFSSLPEKKELSLTKEDQKRRSYKKSVSLS